MASCASKWSSARRVPCKAHPEGLEACRQYSAYPDRYNGGGKLTKFGYFAVGSFRNMLREASHARRAGVSRLAVRLRHRECSELTGGAEDSVQAMQRDTVPYRAETLTGPDIAGVRAAPCWRIRARVSVRSRMLEPEDLRLNERAVLMPTEKRRRNAGRMERVISRRRIPFNEFGVAALKMFVKYDLFDRLRDRSRVPEETMMPWYQELYYQVVAAARRVRIRTRARPSTSHRTYSVTRSRRPWRP